MCASYHVLSVAAFFQQDEWPKCLNPESSRSLSSHRSEARDPISLTAAG